MNQSFSHLPKGATIAVGMSGGVDSSVSAYLLKDAGFNVFGLFMKNWEETDELGQCMAAKDQKDALDVCHALNIPFYTVNFTEEYYNEVFEDLLKGIQQGRTPNPDILCNREIKFKHFLNKALALGADFLATGHYCQIYEKNGLYKLVKGDDENKDQTYFVYTLKQKELSRVIFPVGGLKKTLVREIAKKACLSTSLKKDSTGICFIGKRNFKEFLANYLPMKPGEIVTTEGCVVGQHSGAFFYTIGQRKGLGIGGEGDAWFVVDKDIEKNHVIVSQGHDHPKLYATKLKADQLSWVNQGPSHFPFFCKAKIRYRQEDQVCVIEKIEDGIAYVTFPSPQRAVTAGQSIVFYDDNQCLGGGVIFFKD